MKLFQLFRKAAAVKCVSDVQELLLYNRKNRMVCRNTSWKNQTPILQWLDKLSPVSYTHLGGLSYIKDMNLGEKIYGVVIFAVGLAIVVGIRGIVAQTRKEEWEMEQEENAAKKE